MILSLFWSFGGDGGAWTCQKQMGLLNLAGERGCECVRVCGSVWACVTQTAPSERGPHTPGSKAAGGGVDGAAWDVHILRRIGRLGVMGVWSSREARLWGGEGSRPSRRGGRGDRETRSWVGTYARGTRDLSPTPALERTPVPPPVLTPPRSLTQRHPLPSFSLHEARWQWGLRWRRFG